MSNSYYRPIILCFPVTPPTILVPTIFVLSTKAYVTYFCTETVFAFASSCCAASTNLYPAFQANCAASGHILHLKQITQLNTSSNIYKYKYIKTQIQIQIHTNTNIYKYKYKCCKQTRIAPQIDHTVKYLFKLNRSQSFSK